MLNPQNQYKASYQAKHFEGEERSYHSGRDGATKKCASRYNKKFRFIKLQYSKYRSCKLSVTYSIHRRYTRS